MPIHSKSNQNGCGGSPTILTIFYKLNNKAIRIMLDKMMTTNLSKRNSRQEDQDQQMKYIIKEYVIECIVKGSIPVHLLHIPGNTTTNDY